MTDASAVQAPRLFESVPPHPPLEPTDPKDIREQIQANDRAAMERGYTDPSKSVPDPNRTEPAKSKPESQPAAGDGAIQVGDLKLSAEDLSALMRFKAEQDLKATQVPASAADYKHELPADVKFPEGISFKFDPQDPMLADAAAWAKSKNLTQTDYSQMLSLYSMARANETKVIADMAARERAALGVNAAARVDAVAQWIRATFGEATARPVLASMATVKQVEMFEKIIMRYSSQGSASFSQQHRDPSGGAMTPERWAGMSFSEKQQWQEQNGARR